MHPDDNDDPETGIITDYLVRRTITFHCEKCGEGVSMHVPNRTGQSVERSYCCRATYRVTNIGPGICLERVADRVEREKDRSETANAIEAPVPDPRYS